MVSPGIPNANIGMNAEPRAALFAEEAPAMGSMWRSARLSFLALELFLVTAQAIQAAMFAPAPAWHQPHRRYRHPFRRDP